MSARVEADDQRAGVEERRPEGHCVPGPQHDRLRLVSAGLLPLPRGQLQLVHVFVIAVNRVEHMTYHQPDKPSVTRDLPPAQ